MTDPVAKGTGRRIAVGVTGASGAIYATRTIAALLDAGCDLEIVFSDYGKRLLLDELGPGARPDRLMDLLVERYGESVGRGTFVLHSNKDLGASLASGFGLLADRSGMETLGPFLLLLALLLALVFGLLERYPQGE